MGPGAELTLYRARCRGNHNNTSYPEAVRVTGLDSFREAVSQDHVAAKYRDGYAKSDTERRNLIPCHRANSDYESADALMLDLDNTPAKEGDPDIPPEAWKTPDDIRAAFPGVQFYVCYSKNHLKQKGPWSPRPRFHVYFSIDPIVECEAYTALKNQVRSRFPQFDANAKDAARFFFGVNAPEVEFFPGDVTLTEFLKDTALGPDVAQHPDLTAKRPEGVRPADHEIARTQGAQPANPPLARAEGIREGSRNSTLSEKAGKLLKCYGDEAKTRQAFDEWAAKCDPPLDQAELDGIYRSAQGFYHSTVKLQPGYIPPEEYAAMREWQKRLSANPKTGEFYASKHNLELVMGNDVRIANIAFNELSGQVEKIGALPWKTSGTAWSDRDDVQLKSWLSRHYVSWSDNTYNDTLLKTADDRAFHPIRDYLNALPEWDRTPRAETYIIRHLSAPDTPYVRAVTRKMLIAGVARTFEPGIKFDYMCVLVGDQGLGKSTLIAKLGGAWYTDGLKVNDLGDPKKSAEKIQGHFIVEMSELAGMKKVDVETMKAFISSQSDNFREAYARRATHHPRQCVFFGTTNNKDGFLRDITGNRRFWIINTPGGAKEKPWDVPKAYVDQVWAEAYHYYRQGESLLLPHELAGAAEKAQREAMEADDRTGLVREFLEIKLPSENWWDYVANWERRNFCHDPLGPMRPKGVRRRDLVSNIEIWVECFGKDQANMQPRDSYAIGAIMKQMTDWERDDKPVKVPGYGLQRVYRRKATGGCSKVVT